MANEGYTVSSFSFTDTKFDPKDRMKGKKDKLRLMANNKIRMKNDSHMQRIKELKIFDGSEWCHTSGTPPSDIYPF